MQDTYLNIIKGIYSKHIANISSNREKLTSIPLNHEQEKDVFFFSYLLKTIPEVLARTIR